MEPDELRQAYEGIRPALESVCRDLRGWLQGAARQSGVVEPRIEGRVKAPHSLIKKALRRERENRPWGDPLRESSDKVGVRADVVYRADVVRLREEILAAGDVIETTKVDDKLETQLGEDRLGYHGVHFDVVPRRLPSGLDREMATCEIQLRTNAQAAWAMATHDLTYKAPVDPPRPLKRKINRLTALLELFDEGVEQARAEMMAADGYPLVILIDALEAAWMHHMADHYDRDLTREIVTTLIGDMAAEEAHDLARRLAEFRTRNDEKLRTLIQPTARNPFMTQPEAVLIFYLLDDDPFALQRRWIDKQWPHPLLEDLANEWGERLPTPH